METPEEWLAADVLFSMATGGISTYSRTQMAELIPPNLECTCFSIYSMVEGLSHFFSFTVVLMLHDATRASSCTIFPIFWELIVIGFILSSYVTSMMAEGTRKNSMALSRRFSIRGGSAQCQAIPVERKIRLEEVEKIKGVLDRDDLVSMNKHLREVGELIDQAQDLETMIKHDEFKARKHHLSPAMTSQGSHLQKMKQRTRRSSTLQRIRRSSDLRRRTQERINFRATRIDQAMMKVAMIALVAAQTVPKLRQHRLKICTKRIFF